MSCHETVLSCAYYKGSEEAIAFCMNIHFRGTWLCRTGQNYRILETKRGLTEYVTELSVGSRN